MSALIKILSVVVLLMNPLAPAAVAASTNSATELAKALAAVREQFDIIGLSVAIVHRGQLVRQTHLGYADLDRRIPVTEQTKYRIASISKTITATALMQLWERDRFKLDDPIGDTLGYPVVNPHHPKTPITFRHLLTHTGSFADGSGYDDFLMLTYNDPVHAPGLKELLCPEGAHYRNGAVYSTNAPGAHYAYSNLGFGLLGTLVEKLSGARFDEYCARHIFQPLGMTSSFNPATLPDPKQLAVLYRPGTNGWQPQFDDYKGGSPTNRIGDGYRIGRNALICAPQGGLRASISDLARFMRVFTDPPWSESKGILKPATIALLLGNSSKSGEPTAPLTFHRTTELVAGETWIGHTGSAYGLFSLMFFREDGAKGIIILTNGSRSGEDRNGFTPMERDIVAAAKNYLDPLDKEPTGSKL